MFLKNVCYSLAYIFREAFVKIHWIYIFIRFKIEFNGKVSGFFGCECVEDGVEKGRFAGLPWREDNEVFSLLDAINEIGELGRSTHNIVFL